MITRLRIAPVERWCEETSPRRDDGEVGLQVEIETTSMRTGRGCSGRSWLMTERSSEMLSRISKTTYSHERIWICEHMLEMD